MKSSRHGPVPTKGTKSTTESTHAKPVAKGRSIRIGAAGSRSKTIIVDREGIHPKVTKHGFLANKREYE